MRAHLGLLDRYAGVESLLAAYRKTWQDLSAHSPRIGRTAPAPERTPNAAPSCSPSRPRRSKPPSCKPGEDEDLRRERDRLANAETLATLAQQALTALDEGTPEAPASTDLIGQVVQALTKLAQIDSTQNALAEQASTLEENLADLARGLRNYLDGIEFNPKRLEEVEERLDLIHRLERKYGGTIEAVIAFAADARKQLETISTAAERIAELETCRNRRAGKTLRAGARALSQNARKPPAR